jgi:hypothetical protein
MRRRDFLRILNREAGTTHQLNRFINRKRALQRSDREPYVEGPVDHAATQDR